MTTLLEIIRRKRVQAYLDRQDRRIAATFHSGQQCPDIVMEISPWDTDEFGNRVRTVRAQE